MHALFSKRLITPCIRSTVTSAVVVILGDSKTDKEPVKIKIVDSPALSRFPSMPKYVNSWEYWSCSCWNTGYGWWLSCITTVQPPQFFTAQTSVL